MEQHARLGLAAITVRRTLAGVITNLDPVNGQPRQQVGMNGFNHFFGQRAAAHVRLVGRHYQNKTGGLQFCARPGNLGEDFKFSQRSGRVRLGLSFQGAIDDAVAVQENGMRAGNTLKFVLNRHGVND